MSRVLRWLFPRFGDLMVLAITCLGGVTLSFFLPILDRVQGVSLFELAPVVFLAGIAGWLAGSQSMRHWWALPGGLVAGLLYVVGSVGRLFQPFLLLLGTLVRFSMQSLHWRRASGIDPEALQLATESFGMNIQVVVSRLSAWVVSLLQGQSTLDLLAIGLVWSALLWGLIFWLVWSFRRWGRPFRSVFPMGACLGATMALTGDDPYRILPFLGSSLALLLVTQITSFRDSWEAEAVDYAGEVLFDVGGAGTLLILLVLGVAAIFPSLTWENLVELFRTEGPVAVGQGDAAPFASGILAPAREGDPFQRLRFGGLPREHLIGSGPELDETLVMTVQVVQIDPEGQETEYRPSTGPLYWRSLAFDRYSGQGWLASPTTNFLYAGSDRPLGEVPVGYSLLKQEFRYVDNPVGVLHVAGYLARVDQAYEVAWRSPPQTGRDFGPLQVDQLGDIFGVLVESDSYSAQAYYPQIDEERLRRAGVVYPAPIRDRYLVLPDTLPARVLGLARDLTATQPTPYDQALAIETYLRTYTYNLDLPAPPTDRDVVDYFLFDLQQGYCDYYATAMAVLARAAGLPARVVMGYATGDYDPDTGVYLVTEALAHSWVEIYFPGWGWIPFEPTAGLPPILRSSQTAGPEESPGNETDREILEGTSALVRRLQSFLMQPVLWLGFSALVVAAVLISMGARPMIQAWRFRRLPPRAAVILAFQSLYPQGRRLSVPAPPGATPLEYESLFRKRLEELALAAGWEGDLSAARADLRTVSGLHARTLFSRHQPGPSERDQVVESWLRLTRTFWRAGLWQRWVKFKKVL